MSLRNDLSDLVLSAALDVTRPREKRLVATLTALYRSVDRLVSRIFDLLLGAGKLLGKSVALPLSVVLIWFAGQLLEAVFFQSTVTIEPIRVPAALAAQGYSGEILTNQVMHEVRKIRDRARTTYRGRLDLAASRAGNEALDSALDKLEVPGVGISARVMIELLREAVGRTSRRLHTTVVHIVRADGTAVFRVMLVDTGDPTVSGEVIDVTASDALASAIAVRIVEHLQPYVAASYHDEHLDHARADMLIRRCLERGEESDRPWALNLRGWIAHQKGRPDEAIRNYRLAIRAADGQPVVAAVAHRNLGALLLGEGYRTAAAAEFQMTLDLTPDDARAHWGLGWSRLPPEAYALKTFDHCDRSVHPEAMEALHNLRIAHALRSDDGYFALSVAVAHCIAGDRRNAHDMGLRALAAYETQLVRDRHDWSLRVFHVEAVAKAIGLESAVRIWTDAAHGEAEDVDRREALLRLGIAHLLGGDLVVTRRDAERAFRTALEIAPDNDGVAAVGLGLVLFESRTDAEAIAWIRSAIRAHPEKKRQYVRAAPAAFQDALMRTGN